jgi:LL-H family phage holin
MKEMVMEFMVIVIQLLITAVFGFVIGWLKEKIGESNYRKAYNVAVTTVQAVEQEFGALLGEERRRKAVTKMRQMLGDKLSEDEITTLIESAVFEMNLQLKPKPIQVE